MNTALEIAKEWAATFQNAPLWLQFGVGLLGFGYLLRLIPKFPNDWIPPVLILIGGYVGLWITPVQNPGNWGPVQDPELADQIRRVAFGITIGLTAVGAHKFVLKRAERWLLKKVKAWFGNGDTEFTPKPPEPGN
jgi:hypothetical protein